MTDVDKKKDENGAIDESLYSRQLYVFGHEAQAKMATSNVLIVGLKGLGVEIAKNIILAGVRSVGLLDHTPVEIRDLSAQFYLKPEHVGKPRDESSFDMLQSLNRYVDTHLVKEEFSKELLAQGKYQVLVVTGHHRKAHADLSEFCHSHNIKLIAADIHGVLGSCFVDVGEKHVVSDPDGERPQRGLVINITNGSPGIVNVHQDKRHGLSTGDWVTFEEVEGMTELNGMEPVQIKVISAFSFSIGDTSKFGAYTGQGYFQQVKKPVVVNHAPLSECMKDLNNKLVQDVYGKAWQLLFLHEGLSSFELTNGRLPNPCSDSDARQVLEASKAFASSLDDKREVDEALILKMSRCASASIAPMAAMMGGYVGQEVLKACSGKFTPVSQMMYFEAADALPEDLPMDEFKPLNSRYDDQIAVFGRTMQKKLQNMNYFLVGAGAIGCEMLKNWAMMGIATEGDGRIHLTDMDTIEKSNLNRQFLFRPSDVGKLKSTAAADAVRRMNPNINIDSKALRVGPDSEDIYNDVFWLSLDAVCTALDNVQARLYVDTRCVYYQKALVDSGTLGTKGNTQVVVPFLTESYGSSRDPPEESIPICTLKNFPNKIEHTIQWARDLFEGVFRQSAEEVNNYLGNKDYFEQNAKSTHSQLDNLKTVLSYLVENKPLTFDECISWARQLFEKKFNHDIRQLLAVFPADSLTREGTKFWSGTKRAPEPVVFNMDDPAHMEFIVAAANLHAFNYGLEGTRDLQVFRKVLPQVKVPDFVPRSDVKIAASDEEEKKMQEEAAADDEYEQQVQELQGKLPEPSTHAGYKLRPCMFEKDDPTNFHIDFITACSNLRARNYRIKEANKHQTKFIAGKIIPAIATTTALVTGLVCLELYKVAQAKKLEAYRNTYVNLALPLVALSEPFEPSTQKSKIKGNDNFTFSLWDHLNMRTGDITLQQFLDQFEEKYGLTVSMLSYGSSMVYYEFGRSKKRIQERLKQPMSTAIESASKTKLRPDQRVLNLVACAVDEDDEDVELPDIRLYL